MPEGSQLTRIHPSAVVDPAAKIADDVEIGPFAVVGPDVELASGVQIRSHALVTGCTSIGARTKVFSNAILGEEPQDKSFSGEPTRLVMGCDNVIRENVSIHVGTPDGGGCTRLGDDNFIMNGAHIGHDTQLGSHIIIASQCAIAGHVHIDDFAVLGAFCGVHQFARVGESSMVAAMAGLTKDAPPFSLVSGHRAHLSGINTVGVRRRGFSDEVRRAIKHAYHLLFNSNLRLKPAVARVREELSGVAEVDRLLAFIESSERGISR
ncbi:MAG: acyl-ACP--UDP-N-acetylglucosamine O-acyltransferase [Myxococcales bacterium]|nr:acyl-ACP--UDP-N-acetylglucosamine O-acyltransferase [Myxococcales bacterium]